MTADEAYARLRAGAERDDRVVGLFLGGGRGKGFATPASDYDVYVITRESLAAQVPAEYRSRPGLLDVVLLSLDAFREHAELGSETEWNRYTFAHVDVELDKLGGLIQRLVDEKGRLPADAARSIASEALDGYINLYYRSVKNTRDGRRLEAHLDASESVPYFLTALFALHRRIRPYSRFLRWELETHPLDAEEWSADTLLPLLHAIVATGALREQRTLFRAVEAFARARGHGPVIDDWGSDLALLRR